MEHNFGYLKPQLVFNHVAKHLLKQRRKSMATDHMCAYRGEDGLKCAIGALIPDKNYSEFMEGASVTRDIVLSMDKKYFKNGKFPERVGGEDFYFLCTLQKVHDTHEPRSWKRHLKLVAKDYGLSTKQVKALL